MRVRARAPGRVNLIGDHTDHTGGLVLPMAIDLETTVELERGGHWLDLVSADDPEPARVDLARRPFDPAAVTPAWASYVAGVAAVIRATVGGSGRVRTTLPIGAGLSSSAALEVATALALGFAGTPLDLALACQRAEHLASGVPCGVMDQLASAAGVEGHALLIDCTTLDVTPVPLPGGAAVVVVDSGQRRSLATSAYAARRADCEAAEARIGPLRQATVADVAALPDGVLRRRARHVVTENARVRACAAALVDGDLAGAGALMVESHRSLRDDFEVSTPALDGLVERIVALPGVLGARLTGAGFGGCVVALVEPGGTPAAAATGARGWVVRASAGASVT